MIEFEDAEPEDGPDEDLPQGDEPTGGSWRRRLLAAAGALAAVAALITYTQLSDRSGQPSAERGTSPGPSSPAPSFVSPSTPGLLIEHLGDRHTQRNDFEVRIPAQLVAPVCPRTGDGFAACGVHVGVPRGVAAAVAARFPGVTDASTSTSTLRASEPLTVAGLWSRTYRAEVGPTILTIVVRRTESEGEQSPLTVNLAERTVVYLRHVTSRYSVEVQASSPPHESLSSTALAALGADARLTAP